MLWTHSSSGYSISSTPALAEMAVRGVLSSWLALVMNCFWVSRFRTKGAMAREARRMNNPCRISRATPATPAVMPQRERMDCSSRSELRKRTTVPLSWVLTR